MKPEQKIQKEVTDYLRLKKYLVIKFNNVGIYKKDTGSYIPSAQLGVSDLIICTPWGAFMSIEVKAPKGVISEHQKVFMKSVNDRNGIALVVRSLDEVMEFIDSYESSLT